MIASPDSGDGAVIDRAEDRRPRPVEQLLGGTQGRLAHLLTGGAGDEGRAEA